MSIEATRLLDAAKQARELLELGDEASLAERYVVITKLDQVIAEAEKQEPELIGYQYQSKDGNWNNFINEKHYLNTLESEEWTIRAIYTHPQPKAIINNYPEKDNSKRERRRG